VEVGKGGSGLYQKWAKQNKQRVAAAGTLEAGAYSSEDLANR
jgi:hypothetical protein